MQPAASRPIAGDMIKAVRSTDDGYDAGTGSFFAAHDLSGLGWSLKEDHEDTGDDATGNEADDVLSTPPASCLDGSPTFPL